MHIARSPGAVPGQIDTETELSDCQSLTEKLVERCEGTMSAQDRDKAATHLYDWLGIAVAGAATRAAQPVLSLGQTGSAGGRCVALGIGRTGPENAAFVNGSFGTLLEMDDLHRQSIMHAGDVVIPAALAASQHAQCDNRTLLEAIVVGYEVALRIGQSAAKGGYSAWYNSSACGVFGAAAAAAHALDLTPKQKVDALGQAGMQASGLWQCRLEPTGSKALATAHAARAGTTSALLAAAGLRGARNILEGELGFFRSFYPTAKPDTVVDSPEAGWKLHEVSLKPWPACRHIHPAVGIALDLRKATSPDMVDRVLVESYAAGENFCNIPQPTSEHEARFSFQHCVAVAVLKGEPTLSDFEATALTDPAIAALRARITVQQDACLTSAFPRKMGARLIVTFKDGTGTRLSAEHAPGDPELPMSPAAVRAKFQNNLQSAHAPAELADRLGEAVLDLNTHTSPEAFERHLDDVSDVISKSQSRDIST